MWKSRFTEYHAAYDAALRLARECKHDAYIRAQREYGVAGFNIGLYVDGDTPNVEIVRQSDPVIARKA